MKILFFSLIVLLISPAWATAANENVRSGSEPLINLNNGVVRLSSYDTHTVPSSAARHGRPKAEARSPR